MKNLFKVSVTSYPVNHRLDFALLGCSTYFLIRRTPADPALGALALTLLGLCLGLTIALFI